MIKFSFKNVRNLQRELIAFRIGCVLFVEEFWMLRIKENNEDESNA